eukprot:scaffold1931_cov215-Ochromonas_danica.AAC.7
MAWLEDSFGIAAKQSHGITAIRCAGNGPHLRTLFTVLLSSCSYNNIATYQSRERVWESSCSVNQRPNAFYCRANPTPAKWMSPKPAQPVSFNSNYENDARQEEEGADELLSSPFESLSFITSAMWKLRVLRRVWVDI